MYIQAQKKISSWTLELGHDPAVSTGHCWNAVLCFQGHSRADWPGGSAAGSLYHSWGPVVPGYSPMLLGGAGLGGAARGHALETWFHAESHPHPGHTSPDTRPQWKDSDWAISQSSAPGAGDRGHLQRFHPVSVLMLHPTTYITPSQFNLRLITSLPVWSLFISVICPVLVNLTALHWLHLFKLPNHYLILPDNIKSKKRFCLFDSAPQIVT